MLELLQQYLQLTTISYMNKNNYCIPIIKQSSIFLTLAIKFAFHFPVIGYNKDELNFV